MQSHQCAQEKFKNKGTILRRLDVLLDGVVEHVFGKVGAGAHVSLGDRDGLNPPCTDADDVRTICTCRFFVFKIFFHLQNV